MKRYSEWFMLFCLGGIGILIANWLGNKMNPIESLPGVLILIAISMLAVFVTNVVPFNVPLVALCALFGMLAASPISPIREFIVTYAGRINFSSPITILGALAGMNISREFRSFLKEAPRYLLIGVVTMACIYVGSTLWSSVLLTISNLF